MTWAPWCGDPWCGEPGLAQRHQQFGRSRAEALAWIDQTDEPNARRIEACRERAHHQIVWNTVSQCYALVS